jgi:ABC-2 type transport system ATP-binding protein
MTIVVTTHYMDEAEHCDRIALMNAGRIVAEGTLDTLRKGLPVQLHSLEDIFVHVMREGVNR